MKKTRPRTQGLSFRLRGNRQRSIYQYSNMAPRLSGQTSIFGVVFFAPKSLLGIGRQQKLKNFYNFDPKASEPCWNSCFSPTWHPSWRRLLSTMLVPKQTRSKRGHSEKAIKPEIVLYVVLDVEVEVTGIKGLNFIEYHQWQPTKENLKKNWLQSGEKNGWKQSVVETLNRRKCLTASGYVESILYLGNLPKTASMQPSSQGLSSYQRWENLGTRLASMTCWIIL